MFSRPREKMSLYDKHAADQSAVVVLPECISPRELSKIPNPRFLRMKELYGDDAF